MTTKDEAPQANKLPRAIEKGAWVSNHRRHVMCGEQALETETTEPDFVLRAITAAGLMTGMPTITWNCVEGFVSLDSRVNLAQEIAALSEMPDADGQGRGISGLEGLCDPLTALRAIELFRLGPAVKNSAIFVLHNFYPFFQAPQVLQTFENMVKGNRLSYGSKAAIFRRPIHFVHAPYAQLELKCLPMIRHWITPMPFDLPGEEELLDEQVARIVAQTRNKEQEDAEAGKAPTSSNYSPEYLRGLAAACRGLERQKATSVIYFAVSRHGGLTEKVPAEVRRAAAETIAASTALDIVDAADIAAPEQLGGVRNLMLNAERAARTFTDAAKEQALDPATGFCLVGVPGTGKSEGAKTISVVFNRITKRQFTVIRVRMGAIYGGIVGDTERNWYDIERRVASFGPDTVIWLDEVDKAFGNVMDGSGDSGVRMSLFGIVLGWLSDPKRKCFVVAAMNDPTGIPPEFFRRFDDTFWFDLPAVEPRVAILKIHFAKRLRKMAGVAKKSDPLAVLKFAEAQWQALGEKVQGYIPSEIERVVRQSRDLAFERRTVAVPTYDEVVEVVEATRTSIYSVTRAPDLKRLKDSCKHYKQVDIDESPRPPAPKAPRNRAVTFNEDPEIN